MTSPARRHYQRMTAARAAAASGPEQRMQGEAHELMLAALYEDRRRLKAVQSVERKAALKRELLPQYADYVAGVLAGGQGAQDEVLLRVLLWRIDVGDLAGALEIARYALRHGLTPPDQFERSLPAIVAEEFAEQTLRQIEGEDQPDHPEHLLTLLGEVEALTAEADMHDQIRAKLHKALGYAARAAGRAPEALAHLERALDLHDRVGVKKDIERLKRAVTQQS